jgi:hypothetical protein
MRKSIGILFIGISLLTLQAGNYMAYLLCKSQVNEVLREAGCDCAKELVNDDSGDDGSSSTASTLAKKQNLTEGFTCSLHLDECIMTPTEKCFAEYNSALFTGVSNTPFHPPALA